MIIAGPRDFPRARASLAGKASTDRCKIASISFAGTRTWSSPGSRHDAPIAHRIEQRSASAPGASSSVGTCCASSPERRGTHDVRPLPAPGDEARMAARHLVEAVREHQCSCAARPPSASGVSITTALVERPVREVGIDEADLAPARAAASASAGADRGVELAARGRCVRSACRSVQLGSSSASSIVSRRAASRRSPSLEQRARLGARAGARAGARGGAGRPGAHQRAHRGRRRGRTRR